MDTQIGEEPPESTDLPGWRKAIAANRLKSFRLEALAAAFQDLGGSNVVVRDALTQHLSDAVLHMLRKRVGFNHPNEGWDIIFRTHESIFKALLNPQSADGRGLRLAFGPRVLFRMKDAIAAEQRQSRIPGETIPKKKVKSRGQDAVTDDGHIDIDAATAPTEDDEEPETAECTDRELALPTRKDDALSDEITQIDERIDVEGILDCVSDPRKRMAFHLFMDGVPFKTKKENVESIAQALNISEKTARTWVIEVRELLAEHEGVKHLQKLRVGAKL